MEALVAGWVDRWFVVRRPLSQGVQLFAGLEADGFAWGDADFGAGPGVTADACFASSNAENTEAAELDALAGCQGFFQSFEDCVHRCLGFCTGKSGALDYMMNDVLLNQSGYLAGGTRA